MRSTCVYHHQNFKKLKVKLWTLNHRLPVETDKWLGIPLNEKCSTLRNNNQIAEKMHFIWNVRLFQVSNKNTWNLDFLKEQTPLNFVNFCIL